MSEINSTVTALAAILKGRFVLGEAGIMTAEAGTFEATLPEGMTVETVKQVQDHNANLLAAAGLALGELGVEAFKKEKKLDQISVEFPAMADTISGTIQRSKEYPAGGIPKEGEKRDPNATVSKYGVLTMRYATSANVNRGTLKKVREHVNNLAAVALAG